MGRWGRFTSAVGERRIIAGVGGLLVAIAAGRLLLLPGTAPGPVDDLAMELVIGLPGAGLLYGAYRLPATDLRSDVHPRIVARCLTGIGAMLVVISLLALTGLNRPLFTPVAGAALGAIAGFLIGVNEARALSRARDAEETQRDLERTVEHLQESNERLEEFTYAASHDLQEPLRMVTCYLQLLEKKYDDELDAEAAEYIDFAVGGAERMLALVDSLLEYSRVNSRGQPPEPTDAERVLENVLDDIGLLIEETGATITVEELPTVFADPDQLAQIFQNLISNAITYSGDQPPEVRVTAERVDGEWQLAVADEGIGIDPEHHERIFKSFERLHTEDEISGTGIGLTLCKRIVERHGGTMWVESEPGEGATFYFTLPSSDEGTAVNSLTQQKSTA